MEKVYFKKYFLLVLTLTISATQLRADYVIYKKTETDKVEAPSKEEFDKAYEILMTYQFPMSMDNAQNEIEYLESIIIKLGEMRDMKLYYLCELGLLPPDATKEVQQKYIDEKNKSMDLLGKRIQKLKKESNFKKFSLLSEENKKNLIENEQEFLTSEIKKIDKSLCLSFIPTTLYELLFFKFYFDGLDSLEKDNFNRNIFVLENKKIELQELMGDKPFASRNTSKIMKELQGDLNKKIIGFFGSDYDTIQCKMDYVQKIMPSLLESIEKTCDSIDKKYKNCGSIVYKFAEISNSKDLLDKAIKVEFDIHEKQLFPLYRGTNGFEGRLDKIVGGGSVGGFTGGEGLSYANNLFAGIFGDLTACSFYYIKYKAGGCKLGYALLINKPTCFEKTGTINYYIPPLNTLCGLFSKGETFHPRIAAKQEDKSTEKEFQELLSTNARILKNETGFTNKELTKVKTEETEE